MNYSRSKLSFLFLPVDYFLMSISFFALNFMKTEALRLPEDYHKLLIGFFLISLFVSLLTKKFQPINYKSFHRGLLLLTKSMIFVVYGISTLVVITNMSEISRIHVFGTCIVWLFLEIILFSIYYESLGRNIVKKLEKFNLESFLKTKLSHFILFSDFLLLIVAFFILQLRRRYSMALSTNDEKALLILIGLWFIVSLFTRKFDINNFQHYIFAIATCMKNIILIIFILSVIIYSFGLFYFSRFHIYGTLILLLIFETVFHYLYFKLKLNRHSEINVDSVKERNKIFEQQELPVHINRRVVKESSFMKILCERYLKSYPGLYDFVNSTIKFGDLDSSEIAFVSSPDRIHIKILSKSSLSLLINSHKVNDVRWINRYFLGVHDCLLNGGYFIGRAVTIDEHKKNFFRKYSKYLSNILYILHFIFFRIFPKIPYLKKAYFTITKGKGRVLSRAEVLGRLYFCGFDVIAEQEINSSLFFIAQKTKTASLDTSPSYGPLIKLNRIGLNGQVIEVYKFRTMYPYSEYLQDYIYKRQNLESGGKIKDDFRITEYGKFMRKYWLDELPILYNWFRGELKLFGVRPLSNHYLSLYDHSLKRLRLKIKPGVIPPFYADLPTKFEEITESEKRYIQKYHQNPLRTQWSYFWKAFNNIVIKGARSG